MGSPTVHCFGRDLRVGYPRGLSEFGIDGSSYLLVINICLLNLTEDDRSLIN